MSDIKNPEERSKNMAAIKGKSTKPEVYLRKALFQRGYRYRANVSNIVGHPDLYFAKFNAVVFVHGCFWHRHQNCQYAYTPRTHIDFWMQKFETNMERDRQVQMMLHEQGIRCLIVWECAIRKMHKSETEKLTILNSVEWFLHSDCNYQEIT
jgi:DNA mismatch endonuclease (patch repair protein)